MYISPLLVEVPFPPISTVKSWLAGFTPDPERPLVDLCQAVPDYPPAPELVAHLQELVAEPLTSRYTPDEGLPEVRGAVAEWLARRYGAGPAADELCLTIGASQAFWLAVLTVCRAGDEVIVQLPAYFDHLMGLASLGIKAVCAPFDPARRGVADPAAIAALITERTRAILVVSPSNPTGAVIPPELFAELYRLARRHNLALLADETYHAFLPPGEAPHALFAEPDWRETFIQILSFGKTFALTGYRAGALAGGPEVIRAALKLQDSMAVCQPRLTQHAIGYGCRHLDGWVAANAALMQRRHDLFAELFTAPGKPFTLAASGSFFAWVRHPWAELDGWQATRRLFDRAGVLCLPGEAFGPGLEPYLRLAFGNLPEAQVPLAVARFRQLA